MSKIYQKMFSQYAQKLPIYLSDLDNWEYCVTTITALKEIVKELECNPELPGVMVLHQEVLLGMISRNSCFEKLSRPFSLDLFLQKPVGDLLSHFSTPYEIFSASTLIQDAVPHVLSRPSQFLYEPVIIQFDENTFRLINVHDVLLAQNQLQQESNLKILQQVKISRALASSLEHSALMNIMISTIEEIVPHSQKMILIKEGEDFQLAISDQIENEKEIPALLPDLNPILENAQLHGNAAAPLFLSTLNPELKISIDGHDSSWLVFPLIHSGELLAVFFISRHVTTDTIQNSFEEYEVDHLFSYCPSFATALRNAQLYQQVQAAALIDPMTQVFNRRGLFNQEIRAYENHLSLIMIDIDHFKQINDTYGHLIGDFLIKEVVKVFQTILRSNDKVGRYGGDEFIILLEETDIQKTVQIAERIRERVCHHPIEIDQYRIPMTISMGIAIAEPGDSVDDMLARADRQLYTAKTMGRNRVCYPDAPALVSGTVREKA